MASQTKQMKMAQKVVSGYRNDIWWCGVCVNTSSVCELYLLSTLVNLSISYRLFDDDDVQFSIY